VFLCCAAAVAAVSAQPGLPGHWEGKVELPAGSTGPDTLALDLARDAGGAWIASLGVPQQHVSGLVVSELRVEGSKVKFIAPEVPGAPSFDLSFAGGKLAGTLAIQGHSMAIALRRTGDAKVEAVTAERAVSKDLEGDWEGAFTLGNGHQRVIQVHFRNRPDRTLEATLDSPSQGFHGSLDQVLENGRTVNFHVRIYGGAFEGTMNESGSRIDGTWFQGGANPPVDFTLNKK
jgi:hypothetical protein